MAPGTSQRLSRLVSVIVAGERLAACVSRRQSRLAPNRALARMLAGQARQERLHTSLAAGLASWAGEDRVGAGAALRELDILSRRLDEDLEAGDLAGSLYGLQGILDPLGEALLERLARANHPSARVLAPVARMVIAQERGHACLGEKAFRSLGGGWRRPLDDYREIGAGLAARVAELRADGDDEGERAWKAVEARLARWTA